MTEKESSGNVKKEIIESGFFDEVWYLSKYPDVGSFPHSALDHYINLGHKMGRDPGPNFSTRDYLTSNPDLKGTKEIPLLHFVRHRKIARFSDSFIDAPFCASKLTDVDVFVSCWLTRKEPLHDCLLELFRQFQAVNYRVVCFSSSGALLDNPCAEMITASFSIYGQDSRAFISQKVTAPRPFWLNEVVSMQIDRMKGNGGNTSAEKKSVEERTHKSYQYWLDCLRATRPRLFLIWGTNSVLSRIHLRICQDLSIPALVLERGHFPGTLCVEAIGQGPYGSINLLPNRNSRLNSEEVERRFRGIQSWARLQTELPYNHMNVSQTVVESLKATGEDKKIVLIVGVNDHGAGISRSIDSVVERHSFLFNSTHEMVDTCINAMPLVDQKAIVVFKPHPADKWDYSNYKNDGFLLAEGENINELIALSSIVVTLSTTAIAQCLVEEKPTVVMSLSDLGMRGALYEVKEHTEVIPTLRAALAGDNFETVLECAKRAISFMCDEYLYGLDASVPTYHSIETLADRLVKRMDTYAEPYRKRHFVSRKTERPELRDHPCAFSRVDISNPNRIDLTYRKGCTVLIPVYKNYQATKNCIDSVLVSSNEIDYELIVICDYSPEDDVVELLKDYEKTGLRVIWNKTNVGFSGSVNRGILLSGDSDVVTLNSDALVPDGWLDSLRDCAYASSDVATVTPLSNDAGIFSIPSPKNRSEFSGSLDELNEINRVYSKHTTLVEVPSGHGFCLYIRRSALETVGLFDEATFGRGYSEEIDFCLRSRLSGLINFCATNLFVAHVGGLSFGDEAASSRISNREIIRSRYDGYFEESARFYSADDKLKEFRIDFTNKQLEVVG